jgi:hypothetical protein
MDLIPFAFLVGVQITYCLATKLDGAAVRRESFVGDQCFLRPFGIF